MPQTTSPTIVYRRDIASTPQKHSWTLRDGDFWVSYTHNGELHGDTFKEIEAEVKTRLIERWEATDGDVS